MYSMKDLLTLTQYQAYCKVKQVINKFPKDSIRFKDGKYLVMNVDDNNPKPMLCVHLDTINTSYNVTPTSDMIDYNKDKQVYSLNFKGKQACRCLGGDDRAGLWVLLHILFNKDIANEYCYGVFFDEEVGGLGSTAYARDYKNYEDSVKCFIGLDRRGYNQCATYGSDNQELINTLIEHYSYEEHSGTFTDASNLADNIACINLSVGYDKEHRVEEIVDMHGAKKALETLTTLYSKLDKEQYEVEYTNYKYRYGNDYDWKDYTVNKTIGMSPVFCDCCGEHKPLYEADNGYLLCEDCTDFYITGGLHG